MGVIIVPPPSSVAKVKRSDKYMMLVERKVNDEWMVNVRNKISEIPKVQTQIKDSKAPLYEQTRHLTTLI